MVPSFHDLSYSHNPGKHPRKTTCPIHILSFIFSLFLASFVFTIEGPAWFNLQDLNTLLMSLCQLGAAILSTPVFVTSINFFAHLDLWIDPKFNTALSILGLGSPGPFCHRNTYEYRVLLIC
ncbi:hypothetical protein BDR05DRAFT_205400 [Suillus weaverae]|nr:hypothetical protein BDR05DRAFT_205400 [Suillus weaverae]